MEKLIEQPRYLCALAAQQSVLGIDRVIPIVHAGPGCASKIFEGLGFYSGFQGEGQYGGCHVPSTNASATEVIFGGENKLRKTIEGALKVMDGDLFVIMTGCTSDIIGDDVESVTAEFRDRGVPIVCLETGGFKGNNYIGHEMVVNAIIDQYVGDRTPSVRKGLVNVFSVIPFQDTQWRGDLDAIKLLLEKLGLEVNILFGYSSAGLSEWRDIPNAQFNLLLSPWNGLSIVKNLEQKYGTPFLHYPVLPVGALETSRFLQCVGEYAGIEQARIDSVIKKENDRYYKYFDSLMQFLVVNNSTLPSTFYTIADANYSLGICNFMVKELGYTPKKQFVVDNPNAKYVEKIKEYFRNIDPDMGIEAVIEADGGIIKKLIYETENKPKDTVLIGGSFEKQLSIDIEAYPIYVSWPTHYKMIVNKTYVGYDGGLSLIEDIYSRILDGRG